MNSSPLTSWEPSPNSHSMPANSIDQESHSPIIWPSSLKGERCMSYEAIDLLYSQHEQETSGHQYAFIVSCNRKSNLGSDPLAVVHKLSVTAMPNFARAKIEVTHEVCPGLKAATRLIAVNEHLKVVGFDSGAVVPVSNYGPKKTFNCDVRGRLEHHAGHLSCLAANSSGTRLASGCTSGIITLYQVNQTEITFLSRTHETRSDIVTCMSYLKSNADFPYGSMYMNPSDDDSILLYSSSSGNLSLLDSRCKLAGRIYTELMFFTEPVISISSFTTIQSKPGHIVYMGSTQGDIMACDLRQNKRPLFEIKKIEGDRCIDRMREVIVETPNGNEAFLVYTNGSDQLRILDLETVAPTQNWTCERDPGERIRDFVPLDNKLVTCGDETTIGCWTWNKPTDKDDSQRKSGEI